MKDEGKSWEERSREGNSDAGNKKARGGRHVSREGMAHSREGEMISRTVEGR